MSEYSPLSALTLTLRSVQALHFLLPLLCDLIEGTTSSADLPKYHFPFKLLKKFTSSHTLTGINLKMNLRWNFQVSSSTGVSFQGIGIFFIFMTLVLLHSQSLLLSMTLLLYLLLGKELK